LFDLGVAAVGAESAMVKATLDQIAEALRSHPVAEYVSCHYDVERHQQA
jgi:uncharacterized protein YlxP (DUF503 family)